MKQKNKQLLTMFCYMITLVRKDKILFLNKTTIIKSAFQGEGTRKDMIYVTGKINPSAVSSTHRDGGRSNET